jgi:hypothetical protein
MRLFPRTVAGRVAFGIGLAVALLFGLVFWSSSFVSDIRHARVLELRPLNKRYDHLKKLWQVAMSEDRRGTPVGAMTVKKFLATLVPDGWLVCPYSDVEPMANPDLGKWFRPLDHEREIAMYCPSGVDVGGKVEYAAINFRGGFLILDDGKLPQW